METAFGTYREGRIVLDTAVDWPESSRVLIQPVEQYGLIEGVWPADGTAEGNAEILRRMDAVEPLELTPEDDAEIAAARDEVRKITLDAVRRQMGLGE